MDDSTVPQPTSEEMQARMKEMLRHIRRSVRASGPEPEIAERAPRQTLPLPAERREPAPWKRAP